MPTIGIAAEGVTDQLFLQRVLLALLGDDADIPVINFLQPATPQAPGNWDRLLKYVATQRFRGAFEFNNFVVVQVDTDVCPNFTPPIPHTVNGAEVASERLIEQIRDCLITQIDANAPGYYETRKSQIIFAIAVHSIECWLLPIFCDHDDERTRRSDCFDLLNERLRPLELAIDRNHKGRGYSALMRSPKLRCLERDTIQQISAHNPGFADFVAQVAYLTAPTTETKEP